MTIFVYIENIQIYLSQYPVQMVLPWRVLPNRHPCEEVEENTSACVERNFPEIVDGKFLLLYRICFRILTRSNPLVLLRIFDFDYMTSLKLGATATVKEFKLKLHCFKNYCLISVSRDCRRRSDPVFPKKSCWWPNAMARGTTRAACVIFRVIVIVIVIVIVVFNERGEI